MANESNQSHYRICALTIDEMEIKKHIDTDKYGKVHGFQDLGCGPLDDDSQPQATKALVVLGVGLNGHWKLPLGYLLTNGATADLQASMLESVLSKLWDCGCIGISITFDGLAANQKTLTKLGGNLTAENINSSFPHPCDPEVRVAVLFDACHMLKLARSLLSEYQVLTVDGVAKAKWQHFEKLHEIQRKEGLRLANRLSEHHVNYKSQKTKVNLAAQLLSASTAYALEYLRRNQYDGFEDSLGTEIFISHVDRLFDILNSRSIFAKGFKAPIFITNIQAKLSALRDTREFLLRLSDSNGKRVTETKRRMCILGFIATIDGIFLLSEQLLTSATGEFN